MEKVKLSIIVPVYNVEQYVEKCLNSLLEQNSNDYEIIVVDDGSTDNSNKIIEKIIKNKKNAKLYKKRNGGLGSARNYGFSKSNGDYVSFVDSDDWVEKDYVKRILDKINNNKYDLITFNMIGINDGWKDGITRVIYPNFKRMNKHDFLKVCFEPAFACARVYKKSLIESHKFPEENYWFEDMYTMPFILSDSEEMGYINKGLYYYRQRNQSITQSHMNKKSLDVILAWKNGIQNIKREYFDDYIYALYKSIVSFIYFKPEFAEDYLNFYKENKKYFKNNKYIKKAIMKKEIEDISNKKLIPKKIHYFWFGNGKKSEIFEKCYNSWKKYAPDCEIIEWNERNCDINECEYVKEAYENKKWAFVTDYFRLKIIKEYGGIYVDTDTEFTTYIHSLLLNEAFFAFETNNVHAGIFGAVPNNKMITTIFNTYNGEHFINSDGTFNTVNTIPKRISKVLAENTSIRFDGEEQILENNIRIYSADVLTLNMYNDRNIAEHHYEATWWDAKYGIRSYKYDVLEYYFQHTVPSSKNLYINKDLKLRVLFRKIVPYNIRVKLKNILRRLKK